MAGPLVHNRGRALLVLSESLWELPVFLFTGRTFRRLCFLLAIKLQVLLCLTRFCLLALTIWPSLPAVGRDCCVASLKCLTVGLRVAACPMLKFITHLKIRRSLKMHFLQTSLLKALIKPEDGMFFVLLSVLLISFYLEATLLSMWSWSAVQGRLCQGARPFCPLLLILSNPLVSWVGVSPYDRL